MKTLIEHNMDKDTVWTLEKKEFMRLHNGKWLSITWDGVNINLNEKIKLVLSNIEHNHSELVKLILKKQTLDKIKLSVEKRFRTSYKDIVLKILTYFSTNKYEPLYNNYNDYDSYNDMLRICVEREIHKYRVTYGNI